MAATLRFEPLTPARWPDFARLFGPRGACAGCWCMHWRRPRSIFAAGKGEGNREAMADLVDGGEVPGLLAYDGTEPIGWCSFGPRDTFPTLERSRVLRRLDDEPVWSVVCFFVARGHRRQGLTVKLLAAAAADARRRGARILEGYPVDPRDGKYADTFAYTGLLAAFRKAGFREVARGSASRPIVRLALGRKPAARRAPRA